MGSSQSSTVVNSLTATISDIASNTVQSCEVNSTQAQDLDFSNSGVAIGNSYRIEQTTEIRQDCFNDTSREIELQNKIISAISGKSTASGVGILGAFSFDKATAEANLTNIVRNNVTMNNIQKQYSAIKQEQRVKGTNSGVAVGVTFDIRQGSKVFAAATLRQLDKAGVFTAVQNYVDLASKSDTKNPLQVITDLLSSIGTGFLTIIGLIFAAIAAVFLLPMLFGGGSSDDDGRNDRNDSD